MAFPCKHNVMAKKMTTLGVRAGGIMNKVESSVKDFMLK